jgi:hypothetical protein
MIHNKFKNKKKKCQILEIETQVIIFIINKERISLHSQLMIVKIGQKPKLSNNLTSNMTQEIKIQEQKIINQMIKYKKSIRLLEIK